MNILKIWKGISPAGVDAKITTHNKDEMAHPSLLKAVNELEQEIVKLKMQNTQITENAFSITFEDLDAVDASQIGIWNKAAQRIEF